MSVGKSDLAVRTIRVARKAFMLTRDEGGRNVRVDECLAITGGR